VLINVQVIVLTMTQTDRDAENGRDREKEQRGVKRPIVPATVPEPAQEVTTLRLHTHHT